MQTRTKNTHSVGKPVTTYHEQMIGGILYRVTSVYQGKIDLAKELEDLTVRKILEHENQLLQNQR